MVFKKDKTSGEIGAPPEVATINLFPRSDLICPTILFDNSFLGFLFFSGKVSFIFVSFDKRTRYS